MNWLLHGLAALLGVSTITLLAAPQVGNSARTQAQPTVRLAKTKAPVQRLKLPRSTSKRLSPANASRRPGGARPLGPQGPQGPVINPVTVVVNGQVVPAIPVGANQVALPVPGAGQWYNMMIHVPATGQDELFLLGVPNVPASVDAPLLVGMRRSNVSHGDLINHTSFWDECLARGWYMLAPLSQGVSGHATTSGASLNAQLNTKGALDWVRAHYPIDDSRIYGVGFSGGASLLGSYASRHLDPEGAIFAAMVYHTGASDLVDVYNSSDFMGQSRLTKIVGGTPATAPFEYRSISLLETDAMFDWVPGGEHMAVNLGAIPTQLWYATNDTNLMLIDHTLELFDWMVMNGNGSVDLVPSISAHAPGYHYWDTLDETAVCDWFDMHTLTPPTDGDLLIDRDAVFHYFDVEQEMPNAFSRLSFSIQTGSNELSLTQTENLERVKLNPSDMGLFLQSGVYFTLNVEATDTGDEFVLEGVGSLPMGVTRDGMPDSSWTYSAMDGTLTIPELQTGMHSWVVQF